MRKDVDEANFTAHGDDQVSQSLAREFVSCTHWPWRDLSCRVHSWEVILSFSLIIKSAPLYVFGSELILYILSNNVKLKLLLFNQLAE